MQGKIEQFLLMRVRAFQDETAFAKLVNEYGPGLQKYLYHKLPREQDAEDAYGQTWLNIWNYATSNSIEHFRGLAYKVARSTVAEFYRKRAKDARTLSTESVPEKYLADASHELTMNRIDAAYLKEALKQLDELEREVILLRYIEGYRVKEIAEYLGKSENATSTFIQRIIKRIQNLIEHPSENV